MPKFDIPGAESGSLSCADISGRQHVFEFPHETDDPVELELLRRESSRLAGVVEVEPEPEAPPKPAKPATKPSEGGEE